MNHDINMVCEILLSTIMEADNKSVSRLRIEHKKRLNSLNENEEEFEEALKENESQSDENVEVNQINTDELKSKNSDKNKTSRKKKKTKSEIEWIEESKNYEKYISTIFQKGDMAATLRFHIHFNKITQDRINQECNSKIKKKQKQKDLIQKITLLEELKKIPLTELKFKEDFLAYLESVKSNLKVVFDQIKIKGEELNTGTSGTQTSESQTSESQASETQTNLGRSDRMLKNDERAIQKESMEFQEVDIIVNNIKGEDILQVINENKMTSMNRKQCAVDINKAYTIVCEASLNIWSKGWIKTLQLLKLIYFVIAVKRILTDPFFDDPTIKTVFLDYLLSTTKLNFQNEFAFFLVTNKS